METLIIFHSYSNNTRKIANNIKERINADILEIEPCIPYTTNYQKLVAEEEAKMDNNELIEIKDIDVDFSKYNRIIIGSPVWWYTITPPIRSFLKKYKSEISDKEVYAYITNGGWIGHSVEDIKDYVDLKDFVNLEFDTTTIRESSEEKLEDFIQNF